MDQITVKELLEFCKAAIAQGHGDKHIVISDDNEGNGYHGLFYSFTTAEDLGEAAESVFSEIYDSRHKDPEDTIILG